MKKKININDTNNTKQSCRAKTQKGEPCKNKASFIYCGFHWKSKFGWSWKILVPLIFLLRILGEIGGFFNDFFIPVSWRIYQELDPPEYWECSQDQNFRGIIFNKVQTKKKDEIYLLLGLKGSQSLKTQSTVGKLWWDEPACILPFGHLGKECALKFRITDKRKLLISADLFDANHCLSGKIFDNKFIINKDCSFTWNFDDKGFEVVDSEFNVVFSLHYYPPEAIAIQGVFYTGDTLVCVNDNGIKFLDEKQPKLINEARKTVKPIFEYFGKDWFGKRNPMSSVVNGLHRVDKPKFIIPNVPIK